MSIDAHFQVRETDRVGFIKTNITLILPEEKREVSEQRAIQIATNYQSRDLDALSLLAYAAERGRFDDFAERLEAHYRENLQYVHPSSRKSQRMPRVSITDEFFLECYGELGIKSEGSK